MNTVRYHPGMVPSCPRCGGAGGKGGTVHGYKTKGSVRYYVCDPSWNGCGCAFKAVK